MNKLNLIKKLFSNRQSALGIVIILFYILIAILSPQIAPPYNNNDPYIIKQHSFMPAPQKPSLKAPFGTTQNQYDIFYAMVWGTRLAFKISLIVVLISFLIGVIIGWISGYYGGILDEIMMRITDVFLSIPSLVFSMIIVAILGPGVEKVIIAISFVWWPSYARLFRGEILKIKSMDYITYSKVINAKAIWILRKHLIPNTIYNLIIMASLDIANVVLMASSLSFLGLGSPYGYSDWGQVIAMARNWIISSFTNPLEYSHIVIIPSLFIFFFVFAFNIVGESFRDIFDPKNIR